MKKLSLFFIAFLMLFSANIFAANYNLWVADVQVSDANKSNITSALVAAGQNASGTITYNPTTNILTLDNASINATGNGIENSINNLTINLLGENTITAGGHGIHSYSDFTITGTGSLTINAGYSGIYQNECDLTIENTTVTANGEESGFTGYFGNNEVLSITNSTVRATGTNEGSIAYIGNLVLNACQITQPAGAVFNATQKAVCLNGSIVKTEILIVPTYELYVTGMQVTDANKDDILGDGKITYDPTTNTLTLNNATITVTGFNTGINNFINNLTINLIGENTISAGNYGIYSYEADLKITGNGSLTINANSTGINYVFCNLTIENTTVTTIGNNMGINGDNNGVLSITNSTVRATGTNIGSIRYINNLILNGCVISQPAGAEFNTSQKAVVDANGYILETEVIIEPPVSYDLYVAGVQVNYANKYDITSAVVAAGQTATGTIIFDPANNTLTLDGASISAIIEGIYNQIENLTINLLGENTISAGDDGIESDYSNFKITGSGSLTINAYFGIYHNDCNLTIENTSVTATGISSGILGTASGILTITNSTVRATGTNEGSIIDINNLVLNGCFISQPTGAVFNAGQKAVCVNGTKVKTEVVIEPIIYDLYVAGVQINDANKDDISSAIVATGQNASGTITYDPTTNILTLDNASINATGNGIENSINNLTINLLGENTITAGGHGIHSYSDFTITGTGSLTINAGYSGIYTDQCDLTIENTTVTANGEESGFTGYFGNNEVLSITNSTVRATGTNEGSIAYINNLVLNGCAIIEPANAEFNASQKAVCLNGTKVKTEVVIEPAYDLYVAGVRVNATNKDDILGDGKVTYDPTTNTLTLNGASINATDDGIHNEIENLTINLLGENTISAGDDGIESDFSDFTITGNGSLTINAYYGIYIYHCNLTIENTTVTANGSRHGILGYGNMSEILSITNSTVKATGTDYGSIVDIYNLVLNGCAITQPVGAVFDENENAVCLNGSVVTTEVVIEPGIAPTYYNLWVADVQVNNVNKDDILGNGKVTYNPTSNTLTLNNATISTSVIGIENSIANLTINLVGNNTISTDNSYGQGIYSSQADFLITGTGSLTINAYHIGIYHYDCNLTIENTSVTAIGNKWGICGENYNEVLTITNSTVKATGTDQGSIVDIHNLVLNGCAITQPAGAEFNAEQKGICLNGERVTTEVVITSAIPVAIEENINENIIFQVNGKELTILNTENLPIKIYNLVGQEIAYKKNTNNQESFNLPQTGVYIVKIGNKTEKIFIK